MSNERDAIIDALTHDGDTYEDTSGKVWTLTFPADQDTSLTDDGDWYGTLAPVEYNAWGDRATRPEGFNGRARKIRPNQGHDTYWWQPPSDVRDDQLSAMASTLSEILSYGYCGIVLETDDGHYAGLWGVEPFPDTAMVRDTVGEHVDEIMAEIERAEIARVRGLDLIGAAIR